MEQMEHIDPSPPAPVGRCEAFYDDLKGAMNRLNVRISSSTFGRIFRLHGSGHVSLQQA